MKISEKQIQMMIYYLTGITTHPHAMLTEAGHARCCDLLEEIANQQSTELKDYSDDKVS